MQGDNKAWTRLCQHLARLRLDLEQIKEDQLFVDGGGDILYVVDTNVVFFFTDPVKKGMFLSVFQEHDDDLRAMAFRVSSYLFLGQPLLLRDRPFYILPPHMGELLAGLYQASKKVDEAFVRTFEQMGTIKQLLKQFSQNRPGHDLISELIRQAPDLLELLHGGEFPGPRSELRRFSSLGSNQRLVNAETSKDLHYFNPEELLPATRLWVERLKREAPNKSRPRMERDAQVLAWLVAANASCPDSRKVYLLTGDEGCARAFNSYREEAEKSTKQPEFLLRHPRQFIPFIFPEETKVSLASSGKSKAIYPATDHLINLLDRFFYPLLNKYVKKGYLDALYSFRNIRYNLSDVKEFMVLLGQIDEEERTALVYSIKQQWSEILNAAAVGHATVPFPEDQGDLARQVVELLARKDIGDILDERVEETLGHLVSAYSSVGFYAAVHILKLLDLAQRRRATQDGDDGVERFFGRAPVELRFDDKRQSESFKTYHTKVSQAVKDGDIRELILNQNWSGATPYVRNLVHALVSAEVSQWEICRDYCRHARNDARSGSGENSYEAAYLQVVASRHSCQTTLDLKEAFGLLAETREHWQEIHPGTLDLRLEVEYLSLVAAFHNHNFFLAEDDTPWEEPQGIVSMGAVWQKLWAIIEQEEVASILEHSGKGEAKPWECLLFRQIIITLTCIYMFHRYAQDVGVIISEEVAHKLHTLFTTFYDVIYKDGESYFTKFVRLLHNWHYADAISKPSCVRLLEEHVQEVKLSKISLRTFEGKKFDFYLKIARGEDPGMQTPK